MEKRDYEIYVSKASKEELQQQVQVFKKSVEFSRRLLSTLKKASSVFDSTEEIKSTESLLQKNEDVLKILQTELLKR